ncbi:hypothetical protein [Gordonia bronchialis]|uniref:hypothetical protein n=1 Tax=Gordonia bronchialis TaxID=2054 RepID=UPI003983E2A6
MHSAAGPIACFENDHRRPGLGQRLGGGESGQSRADHDRVDDPSGRRGTSRCAACCERAGGGSGGQRCAGEETPA